VGTVLDKRSGGATLSTFLAGCVGLVALLAGSVVAVIVLLLVGQNVIVGSVPTQVDSSFVGTFTHQGKTGRLSGAGAEVFQKQVAERTKASINPARIAAYNLDYHVFGTYFYPVRISVNPDGGFSPRYSLMQQGSGLVWREDGRAFAQVRTADFSEDEWGVLLEPYVEFDQ
jgi:hypothetical protein